MAVEACPSAFRFASETLRRDRRFASMATRLDPLNLEFVDENLRVPEFLWVLDPETYEMDGTMDGETSNNRTC